MCSLKLVKRLPGVQNETLVMNSPGSRGLNSPVVNTLESLHSHVVSEHIGKSQLPCDEYTRELTSWCIWNKHQNRFTKELYGNK